MKQFLDQLLTSYSPDRAHRVLEVVEAALKAGMPSIQFSWSVGSDKEALTLARAFKGLTEAYGAKLIVNNRVDIALAVDADGVHVGQDDMPVEVVRKLLPNAVIGLTINSEEDFSPFADYYGFGPIFKSRTKDMLNPTGLEKLKRISSLADKPVVAIGGINPSNVKDVRKAGAAGIAVIGAIYEAACTETAVKLLTRYGD